MAKIWRNRIIAGAHHYNEVPITWMTRVKQMLQLDVSMGVISPSKYEEFVGEPYIE